MEIVFSDFVWRWLGCDPPIGAAYRQCEGPGVCACGAGGAVMASRGEAVNLQEGLRRCLRGGDCGCETSQQEPEATARNDGSFARHLSETNDALVKEANWKFQRDWAAHNQICLEVVTFLSEPCG